jgi:hypothetical protein
MECAVSREDRRTYRFRFETVPHVAIRGARSMSSYRTLEGAVA